MAAIIALGTLGLILQAHAQVTVPQIDILAQKGCSGGGTALVPNMQDCVVDEVMGSNGTLSFTFNVGPKAKHSLLLTLRSVGGAAIMRLYNKKDTAQNGQVVYYNDAVTESFLRVPASELGPGQYTLVVQGMGGATQKILLYLRVQTPAAGARLAPADKAALVSIMRECCPKQKGPMSPEICTTFLPAALNAKQPEDDLCNVGDFVCDEDGHLQKIDFSNAGLVCPKGFPAAFGSFPALETLMLRYNDFSGDTLTNVAEVLAPVKTLRRLMMGSTNLTGTVPCSLFEDHALKTLMISINQLEGSVPACVLASTTLEELYMSRTTLSGELPDSFSPDSQLRVWYAINRDPATGDIAGPGFTGTIPSSLSNAANLAFVELSHHQLTGGVPTLPAKIRMFESQSNALDGTIASPLPNELVYIDVMNNSLTGPLPDFSETPELTLADFSDNMLTGFLPPSFGAAASNMVYLDLSQNKLSGDINPGTLWERLPQLQYCFLQENALEGVVPASLAANSKMVALNLAYNNLEGDLDAFASAINPPATQSPQMGPAGTPKRKLQQQQQPAAAAAGQPAHSLVAKKLFGSYEEYTAPNPAGWQLNRQAGSVPTVPGEQSAVPLDQQVPGQEQQVPDVEPVDPAAAPDAAAQQQQQEPAAEVPSSAAQQGPDQAPVGEQQQNDIGSMQIPTSSALAGNSFLYLNVSNNWIKGGVPEAMGGLEMFRSPANSTDPYDLYVFNRGGPDRTLDLTNNAMYGEFPMFLINQAPDLPDSCLCNTDFNVTAGNNIFCPTKATLGAAKFSKQQLQRLDEAKYTCLMPGANGAASPVSLSSYLGKSANWLTEIPAESTLPEKAPRARQVSAPAAASRGAGGGSGQLGGGAIAGIIIAVLAGLAILGSLAYFVGYKKFYQVHKATSFKRGVLPDGPAFEGAGAPGPYPAAAYGAGAGAGAAAGSAGGAVSPDIEMPPPSRSTGL
ncbi:hypothetical protein OEZ85_011489 [Tetradesmus obliquus]|uniref:L domain-like protein n=1 Tax=Tetradesmus obliquus TaxID=3088 RepID=A0ABY8TQH3_TETOB|nr:hypothetical protein OEZ85_011489 [Tetradesmus obliquus]